MGARQLFKAIQDGSSSKVKRAIRDHPSSISATDESGKTPLHLAVEEGQQTAVKILLTKRANPNAQDCNGWTPLHIAASTAKLEICEELLKAKNLDISIKNSDNATAFIYLVRLGKALVKDHSLYKRVLKLMVNHGADINCVNAVGETPLQLACLRGTMTSVQFLLSAKADVNILNDKNETALHWAVTTHKQEIVEALMKYGADPFLESSGQTPMEIAVNGKMKDLVSIMQERALVCGEATKECSKTGYLGLNQGRTEWKTVFCVLKARMVYVYNADTPNAKPIGSYNIMETETKHIISDKEKKGALYAFKIIEPGISSTLFKADKEIECLDWIESINQGRRICQRTEPSSVDSTQVVRLNPQELANNLVSLLEEAENKFCADCGNSGAFWMLTKYGALVCFDCAETHASLATSEIKAVHIDDWTVDDTMILKCNGNSKHNSKYEANLSLTVNRPNPFQTGTTKKQFITQKYINEEFVEKDSSKKSPRTSQLRKALFVRISSYTSNYSVTSLLKILRIPHVLWSHLESSVILKKIKSSLKKSSGKDTLINFVQEKLPHVCLPAKSLLPDALKLVRSLVGKTTSTKTAKTHLRALLDLYEEGQTMMYDIHLELIIQWWLPQIIEVIAILQASNNRFDLSNLILSFQENSATALFLISGEYLTAAGTFTSLSDEKQESLKQNLENLKQDCKENTQSIRELTKISFVEKTEATPAKSQIQSVRRTRSTNSNTRSYVDLKVSRKTSDLLPFISRDSSLTWSQQSNTTLTSMTPRENESNEFPCEDTESPLYTMYSESPNSLSSMLCSVVAEIPSKFQESILRLVCVGHRIINRSNGAKNVFKQSRYNFAEECSAIQGNFESLRSKWPMNPTQEIKPVLYRQVYLLKNRIEAMYSMPVQWNLPEVWNCWQELQSILMSGLNILFQGVDTLSSRRFISTLLCLLVVQLRWAFTKLCEIQEKDK